MRTAWQAIKFFFWTSINCALRESGLYLACLASRALILSGSVTIKRGEVGTSEWRLNAVWLRLPSSLFKLSAAPTIAVNVSISAEQHPLIFTPVSGASAGISSLPES